MRYSKVLKSAALPVAVCVIAQGLALTAAGAAGPPSQVPTSDVPKTADGLLDEAVTPGSDIRHVGPNYKAGKLSFAWGAQPGARQPSRTAVPTEPEVGDVKVWLALDDAAGEVYAKNYRLRGVGRHIQVWVAQDRKFPPGDCRTELGLTQVSKRQVRQFIREFDTNIYPAESRAFSVPQARGGVRGAALARELGLPPDYWAVSRQQADDIVVLVDNVRDPNFYEPRSPAGQTFIAGFFSSFFSALHARNIMTIDAYDWRHRTGANPPDDTDRPGHRACTAEIGASRPVGTPLPRLYEGVFAHEYQHLLHGDTDPDESAWVNEGLSDYAQSLVGYIDTSRPVTEKKADAHLRCFSGYSARRGYGGPENSLTLWGDQGGPEILCDYGAAFSFMQYLRGHFGPTALTRLHTEPRNGLRALRAVIGNLGKIPMRVVHRWAATVALDEVLERGARLDGGERSTYSEDSLSFSVNWDAVYDDINHDGRPGDVGNEAFSTPGAPPNGSDYVRLRGAGKRFLSAGDLRSLSFRGSGSLAPFPLEWRVDPTPPASTTGDLGCGPDGQPVGVTDTVDDPALYSGCGDMLDRAVVKRVTVPADDPTLTFRALWDTELRWDFAFVQVWDDDERRYVSLPCTGTTRGHDPAALREIVANLPGYSGDSTGWIEQTCDLSAWAGQEVDIAFRYMTDPAVAEAGFWVDDVAVGGTLVSDGSTLSGWQSATQAHPTPVFGFTAQLVAYRADGSAAWIGRMPMRRTDAGGFRSTLSGDRLRAVVGNTAETVAAIVTHNDPKESTFQYATYALRANGVLQPGGGRRR
ncbi:MAG TPA: peptidase M6 [Nocardioidaceae bacterium]|nr:peptidase M6 [Nocardioidaceae bacterium]